MHSWRNLLISRQGWRVSGASLGPLFNIRAGQHKLGSRSVETSSISARPVKCESGLPIFRASLSKPEPMIKSADEPESIHREPHQREDAGKSYFASSQRHARRYAEYSVFKTVAARICRSQPLIG